jgi:hypothetical protein
MIISQRLARHLETNTDRGQLSNLNPKSRLLALLSLSLLKSPSPRASSMMTIFSVWLTLHPSRPSLKLKPLRLLPMISSTWDWDL